MRHTIVFDCEYVTAEGAMSRNWCGPNDPDPLVAQIGAAKLSLEGRFEVEETLRLFIKTADRQGNPVQVEPYFTDLTGITQERLDREGISHGDALQRFESFCETATIWSWGKDELTLLAISSYVAGVIPSIPAHRFSHAGRLLLRAGMPWEDLKKTTSGHLAGYFGLHIPGNQHHDALDDAMSVAVTLQHFLKTGQLTASDFELPVRI